MAEQWDVRTGGQDPQHAGASESAPKVGLTKAVSDAPAGTPAAAPEPDQSWLVQVNRRPCRVTVRADGVNVPGADGVDRLIAWEGLAAVPLTPYMVKVTSPSGPALDIKFGSAAEQRAFQNQVDAGTASARAGSSSAVAAPTSTSPAPPPRPSSAVATPSRSSGAGVTKLVGALAVFVICSIIQAAAGSSTTGTVVRRARMRQESVSSLRIDFTSTPVLPPTAV